MYFSNTPTPILTASSLFVKGRREPPRRTRASGAADRERNKLCGRVRYPAKTTQGVVMATSDKCCTIVPYFQVHPGKLDAVRAMCEEFVEMTKERSEMSVLRFQL